MKQTNGINQNKTQNGLLCFDEESLNGIIKTEPITDVYDVEHTPFARNYVTNDLLQKDLKIPTVSDTATEYYKNFKQRLTYNLNPFAQTLNSTANPYITPRRLLRRWPRDLLS